MQIKWAKNDQGGFSAVIGNVTLSACPVNFAPRSFTPRAARGTKWRACVTHWDAATRTASRYGRDVYMQQVDSANAARALAEEVFNEVQS